jgi:transcriptional regulator with XRE-family HTH domain
MDELRKYIREVMRQKNLRAIDIEARSDGEIKDSYISDILAGKTKTISVEKVNALAQGLGVDKVEVFKAASGDKVTYKSDDPWPGRVLMQTMQKIMDTPELTKIVKTLITLKPSKLKALLSQLEKE